MIRRTLARCQPRLGLGGGIFLQHLHQARFANPGLAAEQHHLPETVLHLRPALPQQFDFLLPAYEGSQACAASRFQATTRRSLRQHLIDLQGLVAAVQVHGT